MKIQDFVKNKSNALSGVYAIICMETMRSYVGSSINMKKRLECHLQCLKKNKHDNTDLQQDYIRFGIDNFYCEILETVVEDELINKEIYWINFGYRLYNKTPKSRDVNLTIAQCKRFWKWVNIGELDECWNFIGAKDKDGYGRIKFDYKMFRSNRIAYYLTYPNANTNLVVCHSCDNPSCCNPNHLFLGSMSKNKKDCVSKNRTKGCKFNHTIVNQVRQWFIQNPQISETQLNKLVWDNYNIKTTASELIAICKNRKWIDNNYIVPYRKSLRGTHKRKKLMV